mmetsp:Transcript_4258/g.6264  ORF Transcript_4258/g.6264 Transcript_4258/m.6264 type:complete len:145 (-) Transcript_4258:115-549(-)
MPRIGGGRSALARPITRCGPSALLGMSIPREPRCCTQASGEVTSPCSVRTRKSRLPFLIALIARCQRKAQIYHLLPSSLINRLVVNYKLAHLHRMTGHSKMIERAFNRYVETKDNCSRTGDWKPFATLFTDDCYYVSSFRFDAR